MFATKIALLLLLPVVSLASVDIVEGPEGLYVAWTLSDYSVVERWNSGIQVTFGPPEVSLGLLDLGGTDPVVFTASDEEQGMPDSVYLLDRSTLSVLTSREVMPDDIADWEYAPPEDIWMTIKAARYSPTEGETYFTAMPYIPCSGDMEYDVVSARIGSDLAVLDTLGVSVDTYAGYLNGYTRPVMSGNGMPVLLWTFYNTYFFCTLNHSSGIHQVDPTPSTGSFQPILYDIFYDPGMGSFGPGYVRALGSCTGHSVALWTIENSTELRYSTFDGIDPAPASADPFPFPDLLMQPCAMSCNPDDPGLLLVWFNSGSIMCRHYDDEWNGFAHVVRSGTGSVVDGNIAVCSVPTGYWVAWLVSGAQRPEVEFVARGTVTGIESQETEPADQVCTAWPNPCTDYLNISVNCIENPVSISIFDTSGRLVHSGVTDSSGSCTWDTADEASGTYLIRVLTPAGLYLDKVLVIK